MKKILILVIVASFLFVSNMAGAVTGGDDTNNNSADRVQTDWQFYSSIDDVLVPDEILYAIQGEFPGFSATKADKLRRGGQEIYRLFVDKSDRTVGREGFYLLFDKNWKFIDKNDLPVRTEPVAQPQPEPVITNENTSESVDLAPEQAEEDEPPAEESSDEDGGETDPVPEPSDPTTAE